MAGVTLVLMVAAVLASWLPARGASRVAPSVAPGGNREMTQARFQRLPALSPLPVGNLENATWNPTGG